MPSYSPTYTSPSTTHTPTYESSLVDIFLLLEDGFFLLFEDNSQIILQPGIVYTSTYTAN